jgi:uncharacterized protein (DUF305 family)
MKFVLRKHARRQFLAATLVAVGALAVATALVGASSALAVEVSGAQDMEKPSATDAQWAAMMIPHHEDGIELAELALEKSENDGVRKVAEQAKRDQQSELPQLKEVAEARGLGPMPPEAPLQKFNKQQMQKLRSLSGAKFDRAWLDVFSSHHMSAIMMTDVAMAGTAGGLAEELQNKIHDGQLEQVSRMNDLRKELREA